MSTGVGVCVCPDLNIVCVRLVWCDYCVCVNRRGSCLSAGIVLGRSATAGAVDVMFSAYRCVTLLCVKNKS